MLCQLKDMHLVTYLSIKDEIWTEKGKLQVLVAFNYLFLSPSIKINEETRMNYIFLKILSFQPPLTKHGLEFKPTPSRGLRDALEQDPKQ